MQAKDHLRVGQVFENKEAFKLHMTLYAIANKFRYLIKRSEPGKILLECVGAICGWRVYATKMGGCPRFEIRTLDPLHTCSVADRWGFRNHATASVIGGMMRERYGGGSGTDPRPGEVRELMSTEHRVPITYWKAWKSRESAIGQGSGSSEAAYQCLPSYSENPGSTVALETVPAQVSLSRLRRKHTRISLHEEGGDYRWHPPKGEILWPSAHSKCSRRELSNFPNWVWDCRL